MTATVAPVAPAPAPAATTEECGRRGWFLPPSPPVPTPEAVTYDMELVPAGARIRIEQHSGPSGTVIEAWLKGFRPGYAYGVHVHTSPCGDRPGDAGAHYQNVGKPTADPVKEVWLDFTTDENGVGAAASRHDWNFRPGGAGSVVIHREQGGAGDRLACFTPFGP